jgi:hypothetical protein
MGRFVKLATGAPPPADPIPNRQGHTGGDGGGLDLDPLLMALLQKDPAAGKSWPKEQRLRWFRPSR